MSHSNYLLQITDDHFRDHAIMFQDFTIRPLVFQAAICFLVCLKINLQKIIWVVQFIKVNIMCRFGMVIKVKS